jgi:hypothetical protein
MAAGAVVGPLFRLHSAIFIAAAGVLLIIAWQSAPQRLLDAKRFAVYTGHADARIVESWIALAWRPSDMASGHLRWQAYAKAEPCAVVEYAGDWGTLRRGFCGNRFPFDEHATLHDTASLAPGVPFGFVRDARGLIVPEVRVSAGSLRWLSSNQPYSTFFLGKPSPETALAAFDEQLNHPVDEAVVSWSVPLPSVPIAFDPKAPEAALPHAYVESRRHFEAGNWALLAFAGGMGLVFWFAAMRVLLGGERLTFAVGRGPYAATFGRLPLRIPDPLPATGDAALIALCAATAAHVRVLNSDAQIALFEQLTHDKKNDLRGAGLAFVPVARELLIDAGADRDVRLAARRFLSEWVVQPIDEPHRGDPDFAERVRIYQSLAVLPIPEIAIMAESVATRARTSR